MNRRLTIAIDIDDTLTDTSEHLQPCIAAYFGVPLEQVRSQQIGYEQLPQPWAQEATAFMRSCFDRVIPHTPFKPDARWGVDTLRRMGHRIVIMTARTTTLYTDPVALTEAELRRGGIVYDKLICATDKAEACLAEGVDVLIDDHPRNCAAVAAAGVKVINMISFVYRDAEIAAPRVNNWAEAVEAVRRISGEDAEV